MSVLKVVKRDAFTRSKTATSGLNLLEKAGIVLKPIVEPVIFRLKPDENACWFSMASNHNLFLLRFAQIPRQVVLHFREGDFLHWGSPSSANQLAASDF